ncbi:MAG: hypothetical protein P8X67_14015 [Syntrophobacterales bacterium]
MNYLLRPRIWRPSWRPRVSDHATYRTGTETNPAVPRDELPGGKPIFVVSRQQFIKYPG